MALLYAGSMPAEEKISLLIVEDDANIRYLLEMAALRSGEFDPIVTAEDGKAALDWLQLCEVSDFPALIATDLSMPRMTGLELVRALKSHPLLREIPVAVITSSDVPNDREDALAAGACAFVAKLHGPAAMLETLLGLRRGCAELATRPSAA